MAYTYGFVGVATALTSGQIGNSSRAIRVFDVCKVSTLGTIALYDGVVVDGTKNYISLSGPNQFFNSNAGVLFANGLFVTCAVSGATASITYIEEVR